MKETLIGVSLEKFLEWSLEEQQLYFDIMSCLRTMSFEKDDVVKSEMAKHALEFAMELIEKTGDFLPEKKCKLKNEYKKGEMYLAVKQLPVEGDNFFDEVICIEHGTKQERIIISSILNKGGFILADFNLDQIYRNPIQCAMITVQTIIDSLEK